MARQRNETARAVMRILQIEGVTQHQLAERLGVSDTMIQNYLNEGMRVSSLIKILDALDYEVLFRPKTGMGMVNVLDYDPCEGCAEKVFATTVLEAMDKLRVHATEQGTEIDFYE